MHNKKLVPSISAVNVYTHYITSLIKSRGHLLNYLSFKHTLTVDYNDLT